MPAVVRLRGVRKAFASGTVALDGLDLEVRRGEFLSLLGPSGCGKSTVLRLIAGLAAPSTGVVEWGSGARPSLGFVFQEPTLMPWRTVAANVRLPLQLRGVGRRAAAASVAKVIGQVGLDGFAEAYPRQLSGGMRMRVSIARALVTRPQMLLMDEPFAALDEITRGRLNDDLLGLWADAAGALTVVFVTHSVYESVYLSNRILVMAARPGRVWADMEVQPGARDETYRTSRAYMGDCRAVSLALRSAMDDRSAGAR